MTGSLRLAARLWKLVGSMVFAVAMLFVVAVAASIGSVVEQQQSCASTLGDFGELWADVYGLLGIPDVCHSAWFLVLLSALAFSTGLCVWRNTPTMPREWASWSMRSRVAGDGGAFRAAPRLAPGEMSDLAVINLGDGFLARQLPVRVHLEDFRIDYHPGGQPRDFTSEVDLLEPGTDRLLRHLRIARPSDDLPAFPARRGRLPQEPREPHGRARRRATPRRDRGGTDAPRHRSRLLDKAWRFAARSGPPSRHRSSGGPKDARRIG